MAEKRKVKKLTAMELAAFSEEMASLLEAGISAMEGIVLMLEEATSPEEQQILAEMKETMTETGSLSQAIQRTALFPVYYEKMIELGELSGRLDEILQSLSEHYYREVDIRKSVRSAVLYPLLMAGMLILIVGVLLVYVMPIFQRVFQQLGTGMTGLSMGFLKVGMLLRNYSVVFLGILVIVIIACIYVVKSRRGREFALRVGSRLGRIRRICEKIAASRYASGLSIALRSGMSTQQAMELAADLIQGSIYTKQAIACQESMQEHMSLSRAIHESGMFPGRYGRMIKTSERTGNLEELLAHVAMVYQEEADEDIRGAVAVVEPTMVIFLSVMVGIILLSVMLPLLGIMSGIN